MDNLTSLISSEIKRQFKSVRQFALYTGISQATISSALKNGVGFTNFETVIKICKALNICDYKIQLSFSELSIIDTVLNKLTSMDSLGKEKVTDVLEYCANKQLTNC